MLKKKHALGQTSPLDRVPLVAGLTAEQRVHLAEQMTERKFAPDGAVVVAGGHGIGFFVITSGTANVIVDGEPRRVLGPGDYFGEIALLANDSTRSATVIAVSDLQCFAMTAWQFKAFLREYPDVAWEVMSTMAKRLSAQ